VMGIHLSKYENVRVQGLGNDRINPIIVFEIIDATFIELFEDLTGPCL
jgi:hypothetical protein